MVNSGIYKIRNIINNKIYIGSAKDFDKRKKRHLRDLRANKHYSILLQRAFNKYGEENFVFEIIEEFPYSIEIKDREQYWIDELKTKEIGYNIADASFGDVISNHPNKEEIRKKISKTLLENNAKLSKEERKEKWGKSVELNGRWDPEVHLFCIVCGKRLPRSKTYSPNSKFCSDHYNKNGEYNPFFGKNHTEESKKKMSEAVSERYKNNPELKENIKQQMINQWQDKDYSDRVRKNMSESHLGLKHSEETKRKIAEGNKGKIISKETKEKMRIANIGRVVTDDIRKRTSEKMKEKKWYTNGISVLRLSPDEKIPEGFVPGRKTKWK